MFLGRSVLVVEAAETAWLHSPFTVIVRTNSDDSSVDGATNTVDLLIVELWDSIILKCSVVTEIVHDRGINDVTDLEPLDGLVLGYKLMAIVAVESADVSAVSFGSSMVSALDWHLCSLLSLFHTMRASDLNARYGTVFSEISDRKNKGVMKLIRAGKGKFVSSPLLLSSFNFRLR